MAQSFREQLLKLGLVEKKQVDQVKKQEYRKQKQLPKSKAQEIAEENKLLAQQVLAEKKEKERLRNLRRQEELRQKEQAERVRQLITGNRQDLDSRGVAFRFADAGRIQRIFVKPSMVDELSCGSLAIARCGPSYEIIPAAIAEKVSSLDETAIVLWNQGKRDANSGSEDPYAGYEIPDDLMW
jgi:hypothetical protein